MASLLNAALGAAVAAAFWTFLGFAVGRCVIPRPMVWPTAPALGWAIHSAITLPVLSWVGLSSVNVFAAAAAGVGVGIALLRIPPAAPSAEGFHPRWAFLATAGAAILALAPAVAIAPERIGDGVWLAPPIFDHSKIVIIDVIRRLGLPPANPVFGEFGEAGRTAYYYLWYFGGAELAVALGITGWEADIALTWFTAFATLGVVMGLAVWMSARSIAAVWALMFCCAASLRWLLPDFLGARLGEFLAHPSGFAGWLFQATWAPQHLMSGSCVMLAMVLMGRLARRPSAMLVATLVLIVVAGFESSTYVGGVTFAVAAIVALPFLLAGLDPQARVRFVWNLAAAAALCLVLAAPFLLDQAAALASRGRGFPIGIHPFEVLGDLFPADRRRILDLPAYWVILLVIEFPAVYLAGAAAIAILIRHGKLEPERQSAAIALAALAAAGLGIPWLLASTVGDNNDLGLRAVLPGAMVLAAFSAAGVALWLRGRGPPRWAAIVGLCGLLLGLPESGRIIYSNVADRPPQPSHDFAETPEMWAAVRRHSGPAERVANNPLFLATMTPWPVNISWALLSDRSSCFAGRELALALTSLPPERRAVIDAQFIRVFAGEADTADMRELVIRYGCRIAVVTSQDGAWNHDPFAASPYYRLVESKPDRFRIYLATAPGDGESQH